MGKTNAVRVLLGGVLAGIIINILEVAGGMLFMAEWTEAMEDLGVREMTTGQMILHPLLALLNGILAVWLYVAFRARYGPGPKTAVRTGLTFAIIGYAIPGMAWGVMVNFPPRLLTIWIGLAVVELILATLAGAWVYKE